MRMMYLSYPAEAKDTVARILDEWDMLDWAIMDTTDKSADARVVLPESDSQSLVDTLQNRLSSYKNWQLVIVPVEACIGPETEETIEDQTGDEKEKEKSPESATDTETQEAAEG